VAALEIYNKLFYEVTSDNVSKLLPITPLDVDVKKVGESVIA
jgi:hypothetical protein